MTPFTPHWTLQGSYAAYHHTDGERPWLYDIKTLNNAIGNLEHRDPQYAAFFREGLELLCTKTINVK